MGYGYCQWILQNSKIVHRGEYDAKVFEVVRKLTHVIQENWDSGYQTQGFSSFSNAFDFLINFDDV
jgi:hypothetical protein